MKVIFEFHPDKCSACGACAIACMDQNDIDISGGQSSYRIVCQREEDGCFSSMSLACKHCEKAPCALACPKGCLYKDTESGLTLYDNEACIGCHACEKACPYDAVTFRKVEGDGHDKKGKMEKCHGCIERIKAGKLPACVHSCPMEALTVRWE